MFARSIGECFWNGILEPIARENQQQIYISYGKLIDRIMFEQLAESQQINLQGGWCTLRQQHPMAIIFVWALFATIDDEPR